MPLTKKRKKQRGKRRERRIDVHSTKASRGGILGFLESLLRQFRTFGFYVLLTPVIIVCCFAVGVSLVPGIYVFRYVSKWTTYWPEFWEIMATGLSLSLGFFFYGVALMFICPIINFVFQNNRMIHPWRGSWYSVQVIPWYFHNALTYIVRYTFLDLLTPSPLNVLFYKMMGMKIGKGVMINTTNISDPCLITLEDNVTIAGSVTMFGHYGQKGFLVLSPVHIGKGANVGLKASIMGDVVIGADANILPHSVVFPKTRVPDRGRV